MRRDDALIGSEAIASSPSLRSQDVEASDYNLTPAALRAEQCVTKAMTGMMTGGLVGGMTGVMLVGAQHSFWLWAFDSQIAWRVFLAILPTVWVEGTVAGLFTGIIVGLANALYMTRKLKL